MLPGFLLFSALCSPLITYLMPTLLDSLGTAQQGFSITVSEPTALAAYVEYLGNLGELTLFALVIAYGGIVSGEVRSGTARAGARQAALRAAPSCSASGSRRRRSSSWPPRWAPPSASR